MNARGVHMTKVSGSAIQSTHEIQAVAPQAETQGIQQGRASQRQGPVQSLSSDGRELPINDAVTQRTSDAEGQPVSKQKKKSRSLKNLLGLNKHKAGSSSGQVANQRQSLRQGGQPASADVNLSTDTISRDQGAASHERTRSRPLASRLMHQLGLKQHKATQGNSSGSAASTGSSSSTPESQRPPPHRPLPEGFSNHSLLARIREESPQGFGHLDQVGKQPAGEPSQSIATSAGDPSTAQEEEDPEVSAALEAMNRRGASAFIPPRQAASVPPSLATIPEGDEAAALSAEDSENSDAHKPLPPGFNGHSLLARIREEDPQGFGHLDRAVKPPAGGPSQSNTTSADDPSTTQKEEDPEVSAALEAMRRRGASAFPPPRQTASVPPSLATIPEGDEDDDGASFHSATSNSPGASRRSDSFHSADNVFMDDWPENEPASLSTPEIGQASSLSRRPSDTPPGANRASSPEGMNDALRPPRLGVEKEKGQLVIAPQTPTPVAILLKETLGKSSQAYVAHESRQDGQQQYLLDRQGRVFQLSTQPGIGLTIQHGSTAMLDTRHPPASIFDRLVEADHPVGEPSYLAEATGIHRDDTGGHWRLHDGALHRLSDAGQWHKDQDQVSQLAPGADGKLYGLKSSSQIIEVASKVASEASAESITAFSIDRHGAVAQLVKPEDGQDNRLRFLPSLGAANEQAQDVTPRYAPDAALPELKGSDVPKLTSLAFSEQGLFATDKENRVLVAPLPQPGQSEVHFRALPQPELENSLGKDVQFEGFTHHSGDKLSILVRDHHGHRHASPLNASGKTFRPGWNLSDVLHIGNRQGLEPKQPPGLQHHDFGRMGQLGLSEGKLYTKDRLSRAWAEVDDKIEGLQRGLDGQPYVLKEGKLKQVGLDESSPTMSYGDNSTLTLTQTRGKAKLGSAPKGLPEGKLKAAAVISQYQHVTLSDTGELRYTHIRPSTSSNKHPPVTIDTRGLEGDIQQLSVDKDERLFALTSAGKLYSLAASDWQKPQFGSPRATWQPEALPVGTDELSGAKLTNSSSHQSGLTLPSGERLERGDQGWESQTPVEQDSTTVNIRDRLYSNLLQSTLGFKPTKWLPRVNVTGNALGFSGVESDSTVSERFRTRLSAHANPRSMLRTPAVAIQHRWQGREGLSTLYRQESALFKQLDALNIQLTSGQAPQRNDLDMQTRMQHLELGDAGKELKEDLESLRKTLELSAQMQLIKLGKHQGILDQGGEPKMDYQPSRLKDGIQSLNPNRSGHDLSKELLNLWQYCPASPESKVGQLLTTFSELGLNMSHQATDVPLGRQRDSSDMMALSKARLVLDTLTLLELDKLVKDAELVSGRQASPEQVNDLRRALTELRDDRYENHKAKYYTDHGMSGHHHVEGRYDTAKAFIKAFSNPDHSINLVTRTALQSESQQGLNRDLKELLHSFKPNDDITLTRNYGASAGLTLFTPIPLYPSYKVEQERNYMIDLSGVDDGVQINLGRNLRYSATPSLSTLGTLENGLIAGGPALSLATGIADHDEFIFTIRGKEIDAFVDGLTNGGVTPDELVDRGLEHVAMHGKKWDLSVDLSVKGAGRVELTPGDNDTKARLRETGGPSLNVNLFSTKKDNLYYEGLENAKHRTNDTSGWFNSASVSIGAAGNLGILANADSNYSVAMADDIPTSTTAAVDNSIKVRGEMKTKRAEPITKETIESLRESLASAFHDPVSQDLLRGVKELSDIDEQLTILDTHFLSSGTVTHRNDAQYAALREIESTAIQHQAASRNGDVMSQAKAIISHANPHHLDHQGVVNSLVSLVAPSRKDALASQIGDMMKRDPAFAAAVDAIRAAPTSHTWVTLELKDEARKRLEENFIKGKTNLEDVNAALSNPEERRIKSILIYETARHKEGITMPTIGLGAKSMAEIYMEKTQGEITFKYGADQDIPRGYSLGGDVVSSKPELAQAVSQLQSQGLDVDVQE